MQKSHPNLQITCKKKVNLRLFSKKNPTYQQDNPRNLQENLQKNATYQQTTLLPLQENLQKKSDLYPLQENLQKNATYQQKTLVTCNNLLQFFTLLNLTKKTYTLLKKRFVF